MKAVRMQVIPVWCVLCFQPALRILTHQSICSAMLHYCYLALKMTRLRSQTEA